MHILPIWAACGKDMQNASHTCHTCDELCRRVNVIRERFEWAMGVRISKLWGRMNRKGTEMVRKFQEEEISKGGQESPMEEEEEETRLRAMQEARQASHNEWLRSMEKHPRCAMLPSPEQLHSSMDSPGSDETRVQVSVHA